MLLNEIGFIYSARPTDEEKIGLIRYLYTWEHVPTGHKGIDYVYTFNELNFYKLLDHWNRTAEWKYKSLD